MSMFEIEKILFKSKFFDNFLLMKKRTKVHDFSLNSRRDPLYWHKNVFCVYENVDMKLKFHECEIYYLFNKFHWIAKNFISFADLHDDVEIRWRKKYVEYWYIYCWKTIEHIKKKMQKYLNSLNERTKKVKSNNNCAKYEQILKKKKSKTFLSNRNQRKKTLLKIEWKKRRNEIKICESTKNIFMISRDQITKRIHQNIQQTIKSRDQVMRRIQ